MKLQQIVGSVVVLALALSLGFVNLALGAEDTTQLWVKIRDQAAHPEKNVFDRWAVIERMPLVRKADGIPSEYAAAASVLLQYDNKDILGDGIFFVHDDNVERRIALTSRELAMSWKVTEKAVLSYRDRLQSLKKQLTDVSNELKDYARLPEGLRLTRLLYAPLGRGAKERTLEGTLRQFYVDRLYEPNFRVQPGDYKVAAALLDNGVPFLLKGGFFRDATVVCIGYFTTDGKNCVIVADPAMIDVAELSHANLTDPPREGEREEIRIEREKLRGLDQKFGNIQEDYKFRIETAEARRGIMLAEWPEGCTMLVLPLPQPSDTLVRELLKRAG